MNIRTTSPIRHTRRLAMGLSLFLLCTCALGPLSTARFALADSGAPAAVAASPLQVRIGVGRNLTTFAVSATGPFQIIDAQGQVALDAPGNQVVTFTRTAVGKDPQGKPVYGLTMDKGGPGSTPSPPTPPPATPPATTPPATTPPPPVPAPPAPTPLAMPVRVVPKAGTDPNFVRYKLHQYRGTLELTWNQQGNVSVVNVLPLEEYLRGVVPKEMSASWPLEALKAQALAARTYARYQMLGNKYAAEGFDLTDDTYSQVYGGVTAEDPNSDAAVAATAGQCITYQGKIIPAFFFSASGGYTENNEVVWQGGTPLPYLRGVPDYDQDSPHFSWNHMFTMQDMANKLQASGLDLGTLYTVEPLPPSGPSGRPGNWQFVGSQGTAVVSSEGMRAKFGLLSHPAQITPTATAVQPVTMTTASDQSYTVLTATGTTTLSLQGASVLGARGVTGALADKFTATTGPQSVTTAVNVVGGGWGHRLGLSQWGARGMALLGQTAQQIVTYYYQGTQVTTLP